MESVGSPRAPWASRSGATYGSFGSREKTPGSWSFLGENVPRVGQMARSQRKTAATDALGQVVAEPLELIDSIIELVLPDGRQGGPVLAGWCSLSRKLIEGVFDLHQRYANPLGSPDEGDPAKRVSGVTALVAR
jgi:hypothetical protein